MVKTCFKCGEEKPIEDFYRHSAMADGHLGKCKECTKKDVGERYALTRAIRASYERRRTQREERKANKAKYQQNSRRYNPQNNKARRDLFRAVANGKVIKSACEVCADDNTEAHHPDYLKPLDVRWLCRKHHLEEHGKIAY